MLLSVICPKTVLRKWISFIDIAENGLKWKYVYLSQKSLKPLSDKAGNGCFMLLFFLKRVLSAEAFKIRLQF